MQHAQVNYEPVITDYCIGCRLQLRNGLYSIVAPLKAPLSYKESLQ